MREKIISWLGKKIPSNYWNTVWWFAPSLAIFLLPLGLLFTFVLGKIGFQGGGRLTQLLILFSLIYGFVSGIIILWLANFAGLSQILTYRVKWLARFAVVTPLLTLLILFFVFSRR